MSYVTDPMMARHAQKQQKTVRAALKAAKVTLTKESGMRAGVLQLTVANRFLAKQWPEVGPMKEATAFPKGGEPERQEGR